MEDYGHNDMHKLTQVITALNSKRNSSIDIRHKTVKNCDCISILYIKPFREHKKPTFKIGDREQNSKYDKPFHKKATSRSSHEKFLNL